MIKAGLIGAGFMGRNHFNQYEKLANRAKVVAICDPEPDRRAGDWSNVGGNIADAQGSRRDLSQVRQYADWKELVADGDVDLVDVCAPTHLHAEMTIGALQAGKHVLCEKPMALTTEDCDRVLAVAKEASGRFMIAQCVRFWPECAWLKEAIDDRRFGALTSLQLRRQASRPDYSLNDWILDPALSGGAILDLHVHDADWLLYLVGKPQAVTAQVVQQPNGSYDRVHALWHYEQKPLVQVEGFWDMPPGFGFNMGFTAVFEDAAVIFDCNTGKPLTVYLKGGGEEAPDVTGEDGYYREIDYFLGCIENNRGPQTSTPAESRTAVAIALAEKRSGIEGRTVSIT
jgi:predicted dehydrogenase